MSSNKHLTAVCPGVKRGGKVASSRKYARTVRRDNRADDGKGVGGHDKRSPRQG